jgi:hypothetical protein
MKAKVGVGALGFALLATLVVLTVASLSRQPAVATPVPQPIAFPHNVHVQTYRMDCQYCHADARRSVSAGLPSVARCMGCHKITARESPEIQKLMEYAELREPIPWVRVFKLPEFTYFPHRAHVGAGVECQTCHGPIETMTTAAARTGRTLGNDLLHLVMLRPPSPPLTMGWCVDCHRQENASRGTRAPLDCMACHH